MAKAKRNPIGRRFSGVTPVVIGRNTLVHIYHPEKHHHICLSGKNAGRRKEGEKFKKRKNQEFEYYQTRSQYITCYRCIKLGRMNEIEGRKAWDRGDG